jgi:hypothetical protein
MLDVSERVPEGRKEHYQVALGIVTDLRSDGRTEDEIRELYGGADQDARHAAAACGEPPIPPEARALIRASNRELLELAIEATREP